MARRGERRRAHRKRKRHHWEAAAVKKAARRKRRVHLRACTRVRHEEVQTRRLVAGPATADETDVWIRPEEAVRAILRRMEKMYGK